MLSLIIEAIVQGITEFLPISSSGHLAIISHFTKLTTPPLLLEIMLHFATLVAIIIYYREDVFKLITGGYNILRNLYNPRKLLKDEQQKVAFKVIIATIPVAIVGVLLKDAVESMSQTLLYIGICFGITGVLLFTTKFIPFKDKEISGTKALLIGVAQAIAILPGISRSGATIVMALYLGASPKKATSFSFLLAIPAITGATVLELPKVEAIPPQLLLQLILSMVLCGVTGYISLWFLEKITINKKLWQFSFYLLPLSFSIILYSISLL